jgi:hypothetical protein
MDEGASREPFHGVKFVAKIRNLITVNLGLFIFTPEFHLGIGKCMNGIENGLVNVGLSWQMSKLLPYIVALLIGVLGWFLVRKNIPGKGMKRLFLLIFVLVPFFGYFIYSPIYEGDFSCQPTNHGLTQELKALKRNELVVLAIPDCPFCYESITYANQLMKRNPKLKITYIVLSHQPNAAENYRKIADPLIQFKLGIHLSELTDVASTGFPTFVIQQNGQLKTWGFSNVGPAVLDYLESLN